MKKIFVLFLSIAAVSLVIGCSSAPATKSPPWLSQIAPVDVFWGIGAAKLSDDTQALRVAEVRARTNAAEQIGTTVQGMLTDYYNEAGDVNNPRAVRAVESINRSLVNQEVRGATPNERWQAPDGTWWVRVQVSKTDAMASILQTVRNESADYAEFRSSQALQQLEYQLRNNPSSQIAPRTTD